MTFEEGGETFSSYFLLPRTREDLQKRFETHRRIASWTHGLLGRSPDNFPSYVSGLVMDPAMFDRIRPGFGDNIQNYYRHMRANDIFASHTVTNPQGWRLSDPKSARAAYAADLARGGGGRPRRHHQRAEDARHRGGVLPRNMVRQSSAGGAGAGERIDHLRGAAQRARRQHLVAQALREIRGERIRQSAGLALRRERRRGAVRERARCRGSGCSATTTSR